MIPVSGGLLLGPTDHIRDMCKTLYAKGEERGYWTLLFCPYHNVALIESNGKYFVVIFYPAVVHNDHLIGLRPCIYQYNDYEEAISKFYKFMFKKQKQIPCDRKRDWFWNHSPSEIEEMRNKALKILKRIGITADV